MSKIELKLKEGTVLNILALFVVTLRVKPKYLENPLGAVLLSVLVDGYCVF